MIFPALDVSNRSIGRHSLDHPDSWENTGKLSVYLIVVRANNSPVYLFNLIRFIIICGRLWWMNLWLLLLSIIIFWNRLDLIDIYNIARFGARSCFFDLIDYHYCLSRRFFLIICSAVFILFIFLTSFCLFFLAFTIYWILWRLWTLGFLWSLFFILIICLVEDLI